ncbi:MAG: hypothetical protein ACTHKE_05320 [Sphingomicrobium sp.]
MSVYRLPSPYERQPLPRRLSGFALAVAINIGLIFLLMSLGILPSPASRNTKGFVVDLIRASSSPSPSRKSTVEKQQQVVEHKPVPKPPPIILPVKPTITPPQPQPKSSPFLEMSKEDMAASDISKLPKSGGGSAGDSEEVGRGPNGEVLYDAEWAREPTNAELNGYLPRNAPEGFGLVACKTIANDRVEDCVELDQTPGSHLASAVRQAAWQFRVRPPRKGGHPLIGSWVRIRIDYYHSG